VTLDELPGNVESECSNVKPIVLDFRVSAGDVDGARVGEGDRDCVEVCVVTWTVDGPDPRYSEDLVRLSSSESTALCLHCGFHVCEAERVCE
jgi:hypothetical protein